MHLRVIVNGSVHDVDKWKRDLAAHALPYEYEKGKPKGMLQIGVRTMELIDITFPEEHLQTMLNIVKPSDNIYVDPKTKKPRYKWLERLIKWSRKVMVLEPIPEYTRVPHYLDSPHVAVHAVGIKKDLYDENDIELI